MATNPLIGMSKAASGIYNKTVGRLFGAGLNKGAETALEQKGEARWNMRQNQKDWRVKLTIPQNSNFRESFLNSYIMDPLKAHGGVVFPLTPSVIVQHTATYNPLAATHSNYPFYAYSNSESSSLTIVGEFPVQNSEDARHWIATLHFFRTVTKMFFGGESANKGNPPPILKLNGYGDYVFKNIPVVVTSFNVELTQGVDYIGTGQFDVSRANSVIDQKNKELEERRNAGMTMEEYEQWKSDTLSQAVRRGETDNLGWAPASSIFAVHVQPVYSRESIKNFSLEAFAAGQLNNYGAKAAGDFDSGSEGIGFI